MRSIRASDTATVSTFPGVRSPQLKAVAWQDANGLVWLAYNDIEYLATRYGITDQVRRHCE